MDNKENENQDVDFSKLKKSTIEFIKSNYLVFLLLIPICLSIFFRAYPIYLPITDDWARDTIHNNIKMDLNRQFDLLYPNLPTQNKNNLIDEQFNIVLKEQELQIERQIKATSDLFKSKMQDSSGTTYLSAIDPWLWEGEAKNYLKYGHFGNTQKDGEDWYDLRNGRFGREVESFNNKGSSLVNQYTGVYLYKFLNIFTDINLMGAFALIPLFIITLSIIPVFLIARKLGGVLAGVFAGIILAVNIPLLVRTIAGFSDTDPFNIFFPVFIALTFLLALTSKTKTNNIINSVICGLLVGIFSRAWSGWWYPLLFVLGSLCLGILFHIILKHKEKIINQTITLVTILFSSMLFVSLLNSFKIFIYGLTEPLIFIRLKDVAVGTLWPNVMTTVAEFNEASLSNIIPQLGGGILCLIAFIGFIFLMSKKDTDEHITYTLFLIIWLLGTIYAYTKGVRFLILMVPTFAIMFGVGVGLSYNFIYKKLEKELHINKLVAQISILFVFLLLLITPIMTANDIARTQVPSMTDAWYDSLIDIKEDSEDAIITSWWDFGHWFVNVAERRVTFDGADQGRRIHYVGKSLITNEEESIAILRMLNCGQNHGPYLLEDYLNDTVKAIEIIDEIIMLNKEEASIRLKEEVLNNEQIKNLTILTH